MLKYAVILKSGLEIQSHAVEAVRECLGRVPFLTIKKVEHEKKIDQERFDAVIRTVIGKREWLVVVETKANGQPRHIRSAIAQMQLAQSRLKRPHVYVVIAAPYLSPESQKLCIDAGMGYVDLAGNARVTFDSVFIELKAAGNPNSTRREIRSLFTPRASRILQIILTPPIKAWTVTQLHVEANVSLGLVSSVRRLLLDREWATVTDGGIRVSKPEDLARAWQASYTQRTSAREVFYTLLHGDALDAAIRSALGKSNGGAHAVLGSFSAARWIAPFARQSIQYFYADNDGAAILKECLQLQSAAKGENVVIWTPNEGDVFGTAIEPAPGVWCSGLVQTWLDLSIAGERGSEAAEHLLREKLLPSWSSADR